jgi:hypothetical protein
LPEGLTWGKAYRTLSHHPSQSSEHTLITKELFYLFFIFLNTQSSENYKACKEWGSMTHLKGEW